MRVPFRRARSAPVGSDVIRDAIAEARNPGHVRSLPEDRRAVVAELAGALTKAALPPGVARPGRGAVSAAEVAQRAAAQMEAKAGVTPEAVEDALRAQGLTWVDPFAPGRPLEPFWGYNRRPREWDYPVGRNITTEPRSSRIPFATLKQMWDSYDVAQIATRHIINDLRSMKLQFSVIGSDPHAEKAIEEARKFLAHPDGHTPWTSWLAKWAMDVYRYDAGTVYKRRNRGGKVIALDVVDGTLIAPMVDYFGAVPTGEAPAFVQFVQGLPWDWLRARDVIYQPQWPIPESPYGLAPLESVLVNANTDLRLQLYFLQMFTEGQVPEAFATAPADESDPDRLADWQEVYDAWTHGNQAKRWGLRWLPAGTEITPYKPQQFDPEVAEYVMRRTVAAFGLVPHDLGFTEDVNRSSGETQMDVQFRVSSLPNVEHFESLLNPVLQEDLGLPVEMHFDTGREREDRLMEAQAHQIYVSIGAESPEEVRENVLALPVDRQNPVPRFFDSARLGPVPITYLQGTSGPVDPRTFSPTTVPEQRQFVVPGATQPDPPAGSPAAEGEKPPPAKEAPSGGGNGRPASKDLDRWESNATKRAAKGLPPRRFEDSELPDVFVDAVWADLRGAESAADVAAVFAKARGMWEGWDDAGGGDGGPKGGGSVPALAAG